MRCRKALCFLLSILMILLAAPIQTYATELDITPPELKTVTISTNELNAPGEIEVTVDAPDDISGTYTASVSFTCKDTDDTLYCFAENTYWDNETGKYVPYPDGKLHGTIRVESYTPAGEYSLVRVELDDYAGNFCTYSTDVHDTDHPTLHIMPQFLRELSFHIRTQGETDRTDPKAHAITLSKTELSAPDTLEITMDTSDDISGAMHADVNFVCRDTREEMRCALDDVGTDGTIRGTLEIPAYAIPGTYYVDYVALRDAAGNWAIYSSGVDSEVFTESLSRTGFTVRESAAPDVTAPVLLSMSLAPEAPEAPCAVWVTVDASDDISGLKSGSVRFSIDGARSKPYCHLSATFLDPETRQQVPYPDGKLHGVMVLDAFTEQGFMRIQRISLTDKAGNTRSYGDEYQVELDSEMELLPKELLNATYTVSNSADGKALRIYGDTRYETAFQTADYLKELWQVEKFDSIIVACGTNFPDALSGTYLAVVKHAPILLTKGAENIREVNSYIRENLKSGGTVYILGDNTVVPDGIGEGIPDIIIRRLGGATRYDTNLLILKEAGVGDRDILVCTGENFADSLSASPLGLPILLVKGRLTQPQKDFLADATGDIIILGGTNAVSAQVEGELAAFGAVRRVAGDTRYETSVLIAEAFFKSPDAAVICYARNFPDGLFAGPLAYSLHAPVILTDSVRPNAAIRYAESYQIRNGYILGGTKLISDIVAKKILHIAGEIPIYSLL